MEDMIAVEGQLEAPADEPKSVAAAESGASYAETASVQGTDSFYGSHKKSGTWKKFKKAFKTTHKDPEAQAHHAEPGTGHAHSNSLPADPTSYAPTEVDDAASELAPSEMGRGGGSRMSMRYELAGRPEGDEGDRKGTLKGIFKSKDKKSKQIELDALRFEMGNLQEKIDLNQREVATYQNEVGILTAERDQLAHQVQDLTQSFNTEQAERNRVEFERDKLKEQNSQVKAALQESYSKEQELKKKTKELEELAGAQQNSLEEAEERYRDMQREHDELHHSALAAKAQLVTAQAQLAEARTQREELLADLAALTSQTSALQSEIDSRDEKMGLLEREAEQANNGLESALGRLRELETEQQQLEARVALLQEENLELSTELAGVSETRRQLEMQLADARSVNANLQAQLDRANVNFDTLTARLADVSQQLASSSELGGSLRSQNTELLSELANLREQQLAKGRNGSPLSKWRIGSHPAKPADKNSTSGAAAGGTVSAGGSSNGSAGGGEDRKGFSPMMSQLPAVRSVGHTGQHWAGDDDISGQVPSVPAPQADSSCLVTAEQPDAADAGFISAAPIDEDRLSTASSLKPPIPSSSIELSIVKGPLMASRPPHSRRPAGTGHNIQQQGQQDAVGKVGRHPGPPKHLFSGDDVAAEGPQGGTQPQQHQQSDFFARLFGCFAPQVESS